MPLAEIEVIPATEADRSVIARLIQLYLYDMAAQTPFEIGEDGLYDYCHLAAFWQFPYLIYSEKQLVGFDLVINYCPITGQRPCWFMAEYFVLRPYRARAIGRRAFADICARHTGQWHIAVQVQNTLSDQFWQKALSQKALSGVNVIGFDAYFDAADWRVRAFQMG